MEISFFSSSKSVKVPLTRSRIFTFPHNQKDSQSVHFSGSEGKTNLKGPREFVEAIGLVISLFPLKILFSISIGGNISKKVLKQL